MNTGYSGTPLIKKLGIKPAMKILLVNPPSDYHQLMEFDIRSQLCKKTDIPDFVHLFVKDYKELEHNMQMLSPLIKRNPAIVIWVSWYKKSSGFATDITEDSIRHYALNHDLVDIKVCAVNEVWSGLKLVVPLAKRNTV